MCGFDALGASDNALAAAFVSTSGHYIPLLNRENGINSRVLIELAARRRKRRSLRSGFRDPTDD